MPTLIMTGENEVGSTPLMSEGISKKLIIVNYILLKMQSMVQLLSKPRLLIKIK